MNSNSFFSVIISFPFLFYSLSLSLSRFIMDTDTVIQCMVTVVVILGILDDTAGLVSEREREREEMRNREKMHIYMCMYLSLYYRVW